MRIIALRRYFRDLRTAFEKYTALDNEELLRFQQGDCPWYLASGERIKWQAINTPNGCEGALVAGSLAITDSGEDLDLSA